jgi:signal transduction histidine kinase
MHTRDAPGRVAFGRWPVAAAVAIGVSLVSIRAFDRTDALNGPTGLLIAIPPAVAYAVGTSAALTAGLAGAAVMAVGLQATGGPFNPLFEMITFGPWLAGRVVLSRRRLAGQIETRNQELAAERVLFAQESVRYERARIARELHDIVAHCVSVIVVQAGAGQRLVAAGREQAAESLDAIVEATRQAETELELLTHHLDGGDGPARSPGLRTIDELARRAAATGLPVHYARARGVHELHPPASDAAYRVVQESLTNAMKHAPGAPIDITIREIADHVGVEVTTAAPEGGGSGLEHAGSGRGLAGMRERVVSCGGTFTAGRTATGGWRVTALLPAGGDGVLRDPRRPGDAPAT